MNKELSSTNKSLGEYNKLRDDAVLAIKNAGHIIAEAEKTVASQRNFRLVRFIIGFIIGVVIAVLILLVIKI